MKNIGKGINYGKLKFFLSLTALKITGAKDGKSGLCL